MLLVSMDLILLLDTEVSQLMWEKHFMKIL